MQTKTLSTIQTLSKLGKILSKIVFICCIVGVCGCVFSLLTLLVASGTIEGELEKILDAESSISLGTMYATAVEGIFLCVGEIIVSKMAMRYFDNEMKAGTPFTDEGAKELLHLGISLVWIPLVAVILAEISHAVIGALMLNVAESSLDGLGSVGLGAAFIVVSLLCRHGAEQAKDNRPDSGATEEPFNI